MNPSCRDLAEHYAVAVLQAQVRKPCDKAKIEVGVELNSVGIVSEWRGVRTS